jgi:hypothetical protein
MRRLARKPRPENSPARAGGRNQTEIRRSSLARGLEAAQLSDPGWTSQGLDRLASLVDQSLVQRVTGPEGERRFVLLEIIREYALVRLTGRGEAFAARLRHAAYYRRLAAEGRAAMGGLQQYAWYRRLGRERGNLHLALEWTLCRSPATERETVELGVGLAGDLYGFWWLGSHLRVFRKAMALEHALGYGVFVYNSLHEPVYLALQAGMPVRAVRLAGATRLWLEELGVPPEDPPQLAAALATLRAELSEAVFDRDWAEGRAMTIPESAAYALIGNE